MRFDVDQCTPRLKPPRYHQEIIRGRTSVSHGATKKGREHLSEEASPFSSSAVRTQGPRFSVSATLLQPTQAHWTQREPRVNEKRIFQKSCP